MIYKHYRSRKIKCMANVAVKVPYIFYTDKGDSQLDHFYSLDGRESFLVESSVQKIVDHLLFGL